MTFVLNKNATNKWRNGHQLRRLKRAQQVPNLFDNAAQYTLSMRQVKHDFHPELAQIPVFTYGDSAPGPVIEAQVGKPVRVSWFNALVGKSLGNLIKLDTRQGMEEDHMLTLPHNGVHLHGARVPWTSDGHPDHYYHPNEGRIFNYPNNQAASTLWYHDHTMDVTRLNVYAGLFGLCLLRAPGEKDVLPSGNRELALVLQDKSFTDDRKQLYYVQTVDSSVSPPEATPEFLGDMPVISGQIWPTTILAPAVYRLRLCNGANSRVFNLMLTQNNSSTPLDSTNALPMYVIGTEGGFLPAPAKVQELLLACGERYDVLIDLRGQLGKTFILRNNAGIPFSPGAMIASTDCCDELLQIKVQAGADQTDDDEDEESDLVFPIDLATLTLPARVDPLANDISRAEFSAIDDAIDAVDINTLEQDMTVNGRNFKLRRFKLEEYKLFMDTLPGIRVPTVKINATVWETDPGLTVKKDSFEVWEFMNTTQDTHPMHIHLVNFLAMSRTGLDITPGPVSTDDLPEPQQINGYTAGSRLAIPAYEQGWKDTLSCHPGQSTRVMMKFDGYLGDYVYHCHILEHEDMGMMYKIKVDA